MHTNNKFLPKQDDQKVKGLNTLSSSAKELQRIENFVTPDAIPEVRHKNIRKQL